MLAAYQLHMTNGEYVYVIAEQVPPQNIKTPWVAGDDQDGAARIAFPSVLQVRIYQLSTYIHRVRKKEATLFSTTTLAFFGRFL